MGGAVLTAAAAQEDATTDEIRVEFMGASGGMKVFDLNDADTFLMVQQDELLEYTADGEMQVPPNRMNMAGGDNGWSPLTSESQGGNSYYSTRFTKADGEKDFSLMAHVARNTVSTTEEVPCSGCASGEGVCQDPDTLVCAGRTGGIPSVCPASFSLCTEPIEITQDTLKFSIVVQWDFVQVGNRLKYALELKDKSGNTPVVSDSNGIYQVDIPGSGWLEIPTTALILGGASPEPVTLDITTRMQGGTFVIDFDFRKHYTHINHHQWSDLQGCYLRDCLCIFSVFPARYIALLRPGAVHRAAHCWLVGMVGSSSLLQLFI